MAKRTNEKFVEAMKYLNTEMLKDIAAGHQWQYTNVKKRNKTFAAARKQKNYLTNCATGVDWALTIAGVPSSAQAWYGSPGKISWVNKNAEANAKKYFDIIKVNKTVKALYAAGELCEGDILIYQTLSHTNAYFGNGKSFDSGHAYCSGSGEMAPFKKWIGNLAHSTKKVAYILRLRDRTHYRVQVGAYTTEKGRQNRERQLKKLGIKYIIYTEDGYDKISTGYFSGKQNAEKMIADLRKKGIIGIIKEE